VKPPPSRAAERDERRKAFLEQTAATVARNWVDQCRHDLRLEGRAAAGGWPGTLSEARIRVKHQLDDEFARHTIAEVSGTERELVARTAYTRARTQWFRKAEPEGS
jgi:hypothetical protein